MNIASAAGIPNVAICAQPVFYLHGSKTLTETDTALPLRADEATLMGAREAMSGVVSR